MRTIFLILLIIGSINKGKSQCWEIVYDGGTNIVFTDLEVLNDSILWVAADLIAQNQNLGLRTENGGDSWNIVTWSFSDFPPKKIALINQNTAVVASNRQSVYKTEDKGWDWDEIDLPEADDNNSVNNIVFQDINEGWLTIDKGSIFFTENGGESWMEKGNNVEIGIPFFRSFQVVTDSVLYFYGFHNLTPSNNSGRIWKTTDKGDTWYMLDFSLIDSNLDLFFIDPETGWIGCEFNTICKTIDGGENWLANTILDNPDNLALTVHFTNDSLGWTGGFINDSPEFINGFIAYSGDGGENWYRQQLSIDTSNVLDFQNNNGIIELQMVNDTLGYAISSRGRIYRYRGRAAECGPAPVLLGSNALSPSFSWAAAEGCFDGYYFQIGSSPGEDDLLPPTDVGLDTFFHA
ncbi:MAG: YCF48-related protein, partial [bacterium]|nr:YCF48-related protein [bacterium]